MLSVRVTRRYIAHVAGDVVPDELSLLPRALLACSYGSFAAALHNETGVWHHVLIPLITFERSARGVKRG